MDADQNNTDGAACPGCAAAAKHIAALEARLAELEQKLAAALRGGKRQAAPFSTGLPKPDPKKPGRKPGGDYGAKAFRAVPPVIDQEHDVPLPATCPKCGNNAFIDERVEHQYQAEIPRRPICRQFNVAVARCTCCGKRVQGRHPLQTSDALGCCASQIGAEAQAAVVMLNKELGLSQGKISRFFQAFFGIKLTRGGSCQVMLRAARRCQGSYQAIVRQVRQSDQVVADETGWRIGGHLAWLHVAVGREVVAYLMSRRRGFEASAALIGQDYAGTLVHDGYASYDRFVHATHQTCLAHLLRRCHELLETATRGAVVFPRQIKAVLQQSLEIGGQRDAGRITHRQAVIEAGSLARQIDRFVTPIKTNAANERLAAHLHKHAGQLFTFLRRPGTDATNWQAEQAIRPAVVNRKVWGGNRTEAGATAQAVLMSVWFTIFRRGRDGLELVSQLLRSPPDQCPPLLIASG
jgi:transposase